MNLDPFVNTVRGDLAAAAAMAGPDAGDAADRMLLALEPALRLAALELLSQAADEMTAALPDHDVVVRLRGREPELVAAPALPAGRQPVAPAQEDPEEDAPARVSLRLPDSIKAQAEEEAARNGLSLNAWIVGVIRAATWRRTAGPEIDVTSIRIEAPARSLPARRTASKG